MDRSRNLPATIDTLTTSKPSSSLKKLKAMDDARPNFPGEHLFVFAAGSLFLLGGLRSRSPLRKGLMVAVGSALLGRAASGRGGIARVVSAVNKLR